MKKFLVLAFALALCLGLISANVFGQTKLQDILIRNATVMTAARGRLENTDVLIQNGKIARVGKNLSADQTRARLTEPESL